MEDYKLQRKILKQYLHLGIERVKEAVSHCNTSCLMVTTKYLPHGVRNVRIQSINMPYLYSRKQNPHVNNKKEKTCLNKTNFSKL
jgi:hypothetical protein